ncbi:MAG: FecR domain-containing protein, partial [Opitutae bacterium]|nr:FecR domain-containing protein [Opitutae bacterium]
MKNKHDKLFYKYLDGRLSEEEKSELNNLLRKDNEACERLKLLATVSEGLSEYSYHPQNNVTKPSLKYVPWLISLAASIVAVLSFLKPEATPDFPKLEVSTPQTPFYALLVDQAGAGFADGAGPDQVRFNKGLYQLDDGVIHLRFSNGVDTVMRAPATFAIRNDYNIRLDHGDVWAIVPPGAEGFTVSSPSIDYEDRGTEFAISVDAASGSSTLHVIDGQVDARNPNSNELLSSVFEGESTEFTAGELIPVETPDLSKFPSPNSIGYLRWQE